MPTAQLKLKIMPDGVIKIISDGAVPQEHHANADELLDFLHKKAGGTRETEKLREGFVHEHEHDHTHISHTHG